ncbi:MAG: sugar-binding protein [Candidatus Latescibacterota bacterium]|jgi:hypothetical protein|tara:strand:- start:192 stop:848 length:657 start_codon:yes stop_codon:yes gene_type:complete
MSNFFLPQRSFFDFSYACPYLADAPKIDGNLRDWNESALLPNLMAVDGQQPFASVYMAWDDDNLYFGIEVKNKTKYKLDPRKPTAGDCLELFIDTRDVKEHRANRYCHRFYFLPGGTGKIIKKPIGRQTSIDNAREQAPPCPEDSIKAGLRVLKKSYQMEIRLPASGLNGFSPREFSRLGFTYLLHDSQFGVQSWSSIADMGVDSDPSTWGTAELAIE